MEFTKTEINAVKEAALEVEVTELNEIELALVGGGLGDVHLG